MAEASTPRGRVTITLGRSGQVCNFSVLCFFFLGGNFVVCLAAEKTGEKMRPRFLGVLIHFHLFVLFGVFAVLGIVEAAVVFV